MDVRQSDKVLQRYYDEMKSIEVQIKKYQDILQFYHAEKKSIQEKINKHLSEKSKCQCIFYKKTQFYLILESDRLEKLIAFFREQTQVKESTFKRYVTLLRRFCLTKPGIPNLDTIKDFVNELKRAKWQNDSALKVVVGFICKAYGIECPQPFPYDVANLQQIKKQTPLSEDQKQEIFQNARLQQDDKFIDYFELMENTAFRISDVWNIKFCQFKQNWDIDITCQKTGSVYNLNFQSEAKRILRIRNSIDRFDANASIFQQYFGIKRLDSLTKLFNKKMKLYSGDNTLTSHSIRKKAMNELEDLKEGLGQQYTKSNRYVFLKHYKDQKNVKYQSLVKKIRKRRKSNFKRTKGESKGKGNGNK